MRIRSCAVYIFVVLGLGATATLSQPRFEGRVAVEWLRTSGADRDMRLLEAFSFVDDAGVKWEAPAGAVINGASIPPVFWSTIGPPFVGKYRYAAVIHDYYCEVRTAPWKDTHRMFYAALIAAKVPRAKAKVMYAAVYAAGPRWEKVVTIGLEGPQETVFSRTPPGISEQRIRELELRLEVDDLSLEAVEALATAPVQ